MDSNEKFKLAMCRVKHMAQEENHEGFVEKLASDEHIFKRNPAEKRVMKKISEQIGTDPVSSTADPKYTPIVLMANPAIIQSFITDSMPKTRWFLRNIYCAAFNVMLKCVKQSEGTLPPPGSIMHIRLFSEAIFHNGKSNEMMYIGEFNTTDIFLNKLQGDYHEYDQYVRHMIKIADRHATHYPCWVSIIYHDGLSHKYTFHMRTLIMRDVPNLWADIPGNIEEKMYDHREAAATAHNIAAREFYNYLHPQDIPFHKGAPQGMPIYY